MRLIIYLTINFILFISPVFSGEKGRFINVKRALWYLPYLKNEHTEARNTNRILLTMARERYREPEKILIGIPYLQEVIVMPAEQGLSVLTFRVTTSLPDGKVLFRGFSTGSLLVPDECTIAFTWWKKSDSAGTVVSRTRKATLTDTSGALIQIPVLGYKPGTDSILAADPVFSYSDQALGRYLGFIELVNDYYAASLLTDSLLLRGRSLPILRAADLPGAMIFVEEIGRVVDVLASRNFSNRLTYGGNDPLDLSARSQELLRLSRTLRYTFEEKLNGSGVIPYSGPPDSLCNVFIDQLVRYIGCSQLVDDKGSTVYQDILNKSFQGNVFDDDLAILARIISKMYPGASPDTLMNYFSGSLLQSFIRRAELLNRQFLYTDAYQLMTCAQQYITLNPFLRSQENAGVVMKTASLGIYHSYLGIAGSSLKTGRLKLAGDYLQKAEDYRINHPGIPEDSSYLRMNRELLADRLIQCDQLIASGRYQDALGCLDSLTMAEDGKVSRFLTADLENRKIIARGGLFEEAVTDAEMLFRQGASAMAMVRYQDALQLLGRSPASNATLARIDSLTSLADRFRYEEWIRLGEQSYFNRNYAMAVSNFDSALRIARAGRVEADPVIDTLYSQSKKREFIAEIRSGQSLIWNNQLNEADAYAEKMEERAREMNLDSNPQVRRELDAYMKKTGGQECRLIADSFNILMIRAGQVLAFGNYRRGVAIYNQMIDLEKGHPQCAFNPISLRDSVRKYEAAAGYQQLITEADAAAASGEYHSTIEKLYSAEKLYRDYRLEKSGLPRTDVYNYVRVRRNPLLTERAMGYCYNRQWYPEAFRFLQIMKEQGVPEKSITAVQQQVGKQLAIGDKRQKPKGDPGQFVRNYTGQDPWYKAFSKAYLESWKN